MSTSINSSGITFPNGTTQTTAATASGTVTSVATGNGLQGGTITSTGTLSIAAPSFNTVGSYSMVYTQGNGNPNGTVMTGGSNYSAGTGVGQLQSGGFSTLNTGCGPQPANMWVTNNLSGTWKWMASSMPVAQNGVDYSGKIVGLACRVS